MASFQKGGKKEPETFIAANQGKSIRAQDALALFRMNAIPGMICLSQALMSLV